MSLTVSLISVFATLGFMSGSAARERAEKRGPPPPLRAVPERQEELMRLWHNFNRMEYRQLAYQEFKKLVGRPVPLERYSMSGNGLPFQSILCFIAEKEDWIYHDTSDSNYAFFLIPEEIRLGYIERNSLWAEQQRHYLNWHQEADSRWPEYDRYFAGLILPEDYFDEGSFLFAVEKEVQIMRESDRAARDILSA